ncbi:hypothetical protein PVAG01_05824 [Phlyctema vagabunda]|uniref:Ycf15 n=1 Tax=Phlyctema vagabunda TaxID=108571 RepID=A0ABR4PEC2_9HELO
MRCQVPQHNIAFETNCTYRRESPSGLRDIRSLWALQEFPRLHTASVVK